MSNNYAKFSNIALFSIVNRLSVYIISVCVVSNVLSQSASIPLNDWYYHQIDRLEVKQGNFGHSFNSSFKPLQRKNIGSFLDSLPSKLKAEPAYNYLALDNRAWVEDSLKLNQGIFKTFFKYPEDAYAVYTEDFQLRANPVLHLTYGLESGQELRPWINTRGAEISGMIDKKVGFYSFIGENQALFPSYVRGFTRERDAVPHEGFYKTFRSADSVDFFHVRGYFTFNASKHINIQTGYDRLFLGDGIRSMLLSDFASNYMFLKVDTKIWKLNYTNIFTLMKPEAPSALETVPNKYMAIHYLSYNILDNLRVGLFENIIFGAQGYYVPYLNPIIFYRAVEHQNGSGDNAIVGADFRWDFLRSFSLYGQFIIDEFLLDNLRERNGWWANKYGGQLGLKYFDAFKIPRLDLQAEANFARPYTYAHTNFRGGQFDLITSYTHYNQPVAHPLGANFREALFSLRYQPIDKLFLDARVILAEYGQDTTGINWGGDILKNYADGRPQDFGNETTQGIYTRLTYLDITVSYMLYHNLFVDFSYISRTEDIESIIPSTEITFFDVGIRYNFSRRRHEF